MVEPGFKNIANEIGLREVLEQNLPKLWQFIFNLACYEVACDRQSNDRGFKTVCSN